MVSDLQLGGQRAGFLLGAKDKQTWWRVPPEPEAPLGPAGSLVECDVPPQKGFHRSHLSCSHLSSSPEAHQSVLRAPGPSNRRRRKPGHELMGGGDGRKGVRERLPGEGTLTASGWWRGGAWTWTLAGGSPPPGPAQMASQCCNCGETPPQCLPGAGGGWGGPGELGSSPEEARNAPSPQHPEEVRADPCVATNTPKG